MFNSYLKTFQRKVLKTGDVAEALIKVIHEYPASASEQLTLLKLNEQLLTGEIEDIEDGATGCEAMDEVLKFAKIFNKDYEVNLLEWQLAEGKLFIQALLPILEFKLDKDDLSNFEEAYLASMQAKLREGTPFTFVMQETLSSEKDDFNLELMSDEFKAFITYLNLRYELYVKAGPRGMDRPQQQDLKAMILHIQSLEKKMAEAQFEIFHAAKVEDKLHSLYVNFVITLNRELLKTDEPAQLLERLTQIDQVPLFQRAPYAIQCKQTVQEFKAFLQETQEGTDKTRLEVFLESRLPKQYELADSWHELRPDWRMSIDLKHGIISKAFAAKTTLCHGKLTSCDAMMAHMMTHPELPKDNLNQEHLAEDVITVDALFTSLHNHMKRHGWQPYKNTLLGGALDQKLEQKKHYFLGWQTYLKTRYPEKPFTLQDVFCHSYQVFGNTHPTLLLSKLNWPKPSIPDGDNPDLDEKTEFSAPLTTPLFNSKTRNTK